MTGEEASHKGSAASLGCLSSQVSRRVGRSLEQQHHNGGLFKEAKGYSFQGHVQFGTDYGLDRTVLVDLVRKIHSGEEEHPSGPIELSRLGPSHRMITSSLVFSGPVV